MEAEFFHFHGDYVDFAYWLEDYEEDPLEGLTQATPLVKKSRARSDMRRLHPTIRARVLEKLEKLWANWDEHPKKALN